MTKNLQQIFDYIMELVSVDREVTRQTAGLRKAQSAILDEITRKCGSECSELFEALASIDGETQSYYNEALFEAALTLGMELGRLGASPRA